MKWGYAAREPQVIAHSGYRPMWMLGGPPQDAVGLLRSLCCFTEAKKAWEEFYFKIKAGFRLYLALYTAVWGGLLCHNRHSSIYLAMAWRPSTGNPSFTEPLSALRLGVGAVAIKDE